MLALRAAVHGVGAQVALLAVLVPLEPRALVQAVAMPQVAAVPPADVASARLPAVAL